MEMEGGKGQLDAAGYRLYRQLCSLRRAYAVRRGIPTWQVIPSPTLRLICMQPPPDRARLRAIAGMGSRRDRLYGDDIMRIIKNRGIPPFTHVGKEAPPG